MKRTREEDGETVLEDEPAKRSFTTTVVVQYGNATGLLNASQTVLEDILYRVPTEPASHCGLLFFFDIAVVEKSHACVTVGLSPREGAHRDLVAQGNLPCPIHGPFWCSCGPMKLAAAQLRLLLTSVLRFPDDFLVTLVVDDARADFPHIWIDSLARRWFVQLVGTPFPPCQIGPFCLSPSDNVETMAQRWTQLLFEQQQRSNYCAHCGAETSSFCCLCRCFLCARCWQMCDVCGRQICRACCNYVDQSGYMCFSCLSG